MKILITGFDAFGNETINPSWETVKKIKKYIGKIEVIKVQIPTIFYKSSNILFQEIKKINPDVVICVGQAGGRYDLTIERVAINIDDAGMPDNDGNQPINQTIYNDGENAYFSNLPIKNILKVLKESKIPISISNTAGTYVCNHLMYSLLYYINKNQLNIKAGFIHIPYILEQIIDKKNTPYMEKETITRGLEKIIEVVFKDKNDMEI